LGSVVATNKALGLSALWHFMNGHGVHEKTLAELKSGFAYDPDPDPLGANTAWQKLNLLAHNINVGFHVEALRPPKAKTQKRTASYGWRRGFGRRPSRRPCDGSTFEAVEGRSR
jgi:hypothetical protein